MTVVPSPHREELPVLAIVAAASITQANANSKKKIVISVERRDIISKVCRSRLGGHRKPQQQKIQPTHNARFVEVKEPTDSADDPIYSTFQLSSPGTAPLIVTVNAKSVDLKMEIDTGASVSVISEQMYWTVWSKEQCPVLQQSTAQLRTYSGELLCVLGSITVSVSYRDQQCDLPLLVARGVSDELPLLGRDWLRVLKLDWKAVHLVQGPSNSMDQQFSTGKLKFDLRLIATQTFSTVSYIEKCPL